VPPPGLPVGARGRRWQRHPGRRREGEDLCLLWGLFVQRIVYRQLLWVALAKALWNAVAGFAVGWGKLARTGSATAGPTTGGEPPAT
jgi:hypothetical protein